MGKKKGGSGKKRTSKLKMPEAKRSRAPSNLGRATQTVLRQGSANLVRAPKLIQRSRGR
jgi:hypothetical protein